MLHKQNKKQKKKKEKNSLFVSHLCHSLFIMWEWGGLEEHEHERRKNEKIDLVKMERGKATLTPTICLILTQCCSSPLLFLSVFDFFPVLSESSLLLFLTSSYFDFVPSPFLLFFVHQLSLFPFLRCFPSHFPTLISFLSSCFLIHPLRFPWKSFYIWYLCFFVCLFFGCSLPLFLNLSGFIHASSLFLCSPSSLLWFVINPLSCLRLSPEGFVRNPLITSCLLKPLKN